MDENLVEEFQRNYQAGLASFLANVSSNFLAAIDNIDHALDRAEKFGNDLGSINVLKKNYGILVAIAYDPNTEGLKDLPLDLAGERLVQYLEQLSFEDYEA
ncbi:MAG: hypothetical protein WAZ77_14275 [Candidatus Nitrosopolaris sp.]